MQSPEPFQSITVVYDDGASCLVFVPHQFGFAVLSLKSICAAFVVSLSIFFLHVLSYTVIMKSTSHSLYSQFGFSIFPIFGEGFAGQLKPVRGPVGQSLRNAGIWLSMFLGTLSRCACDRTCTGTIGDHVVFTLGIGR